MEGRRNKEINKVMKERKIGRLDEKEKSGGRNKGRKKETKEEWKDGFI